MKKNTLLFTICLALLLAGNAFCAPFVSFWVERTDDGTTGVWTYTLYNDSNIPLSLDSFGLFGSSASTLQAAGPDPVGWEYLEEDLFDYYPGWQVIWEAGMENVPDMGQSVAGFSVIAPQGATAPTQFELIYIDTDAWEYVSFYGDIYDPNSVPEPSSMMSLAAALPLMGAAALRRKRRA
ncbi:MAG: PEP-CTERM sorting domain-containing protein [Armatimonadota bacterium]